MENKTKLNRCVLIILAIIVTIFLFTCYHNLGDKFYLSIDEISLRNKTTDITIGNKSDFCYNKIPHDYLTISFDNNDSVSWRVNTDYLNSDSSLYYLKINNKNVNLHSIDSGDVISINGTTITYEEIQDLLAGTKNEYVSLRYLLAKRVENDTSSAYTYINDKKIKSFIYRKKRLLKMGSPEVVILDRYTTLRHDGDIIPFAMGGKEKGDQLKVQFYQYESYAFSKAAGKRHQFRINEKCYISLTRPICTEWGAGHVMLRKTGENTSISFPKALLYVESENAVRQMAQQSTGTITFQQNDHSFPRPSTILIPYFSNNIPQDVCNVSVDTNKVGSINSFFSLLNGQNPLTHHSAGLFSCCKVTLFFSFRISILRNFLVQQFDY